MARTVIKLPIYTLFVFTIKENDYTRIEVASLLRVRLPLQFLLRHCFMLKCCVFSKSFPEALLKAQFKLSCSDSYLREVGVLVFSVCLAFGCFVYRVIFYVQVFRAVLRMPSEQGRHKAFSSLTWPCPPCIASLPCWPTSFHHLPIPGPDAFSSVPSVASIRELLIYSRRNKELNEALSMF